MASETIVTQCPQCGNRFKASVLSAGKQAICAKCGGTFIVVEKAPQPTVYKGAEKSMEDDILSPPVQTPSYKETPFRGGPNRLGSRDRPVAVEDDSGRSRVPEGKSAPTYWVLRWAADAYVVLGVLGMITGFVLMACGLFGGHHGDPATQATSRGVLLLWGFGVLISGTVSIALGQALRAFRDIAINSYLAANSFRG